MYKILNFYNIQFFGCIVLRILCNFKYIALRILRNFEYIALRILRNFEHIILHTAHFRMYSLIDTRYMNIAYFGYIAL